MSDPLPGYGSSLSGFDYLPLKLENGMDGMLKVPVLIPCRVTAPHFLALITGS
jgi:hypothetical protein